MSLIKDTLSPEQIVGSEKESWFNKFKNHAMVRGFTHMVKKAILIGMTIFLGVFITIIIMNRDVVVGFTTVPAQLDASLERQIQRSVNQYVRDTPGLDNLPADERAQKVEAFREELIQKSGLDLPYFPRHLKWTLNALKLDWGRLKIGAIDPLYQTGYFDLDDILQKYLPRTLLLVGCAYLIVFLVGLPLALTLSRNYGKWYDRIFSVIAPLSSIPSWLIGILLIVIFAVEFKVFPISGMYDLIPPKNFEEAVPVVLRHMVLPVASIVISILFHLVYSWRTYFLTFATEDYYELGKAIGLSNRRLQRDYILRPSLPYVITSFSLMFISFWQTTMALEIVFSWPGLGWLYINKGLPNLWGESVYPGDLLISISVLVLFAYLMGLVVLSLELVYVLVDPRIKYTKNSLSLRLMKHRKNLFKSIKQFFQPKNTADKKRNISAITRKNNHQHQPDFKVKIPRIKFWTKFKNIIREIKRYPSAIFGLFVILILITGSLYAVIFLPYEKIADDWERAYLTGKVRTPRLAKPAWINLLPKNNYLSSIVLNTETGDAKREENAFSDSINQIVYTFSFDYDYSSIPQEMLLYISGEYENKTPFLSLIWKTPDGREIALSSKAAEEIVVYNMVDEIPIRRLLADHPNWQNWYKASDPKLTPPHQLLFADPDSTQAEILPGQYQLVIEGLIFEEGDDVQVEMVLLGQVYGIAGTDNNRRELYVPLLWGMPFALIIGLSGAVSTTVISMIIAAAGVWYGGWVDDLVQRMIDVNLVLPVLAISVMAYTFLGISIWTILLIYVFLNVFGMPAKNFRAAFLQIKEAPYIEASKAYGAKSWRIISRYMVPKLIPVLIPQLVILIPSFVFLEATLGFFNIKMMYPTWGKIIYEASTKGALFSSRYWMLQPITLLLLTGLGFSLFGFALERILAPRLMND